MQQEPLKPQRFILLDKWRRAPDVESSRLATTVAATGSGLVPANGWSRLSPSSNNDTSSGPSSKMVEPVLGGGVARRQTLPPSSSALPATTKRKRKKRRVQQPPPLDDEDEEEEDSVSQSAGPPMPTGSGEVPERGRFNFELQRHCVRERQGSRSFRCDVCGGTYRHAFSLKRHYLRTHVNYIYLSSSDISNCNINLSARDEADREEFRRRLNRGGGSGTVVMTGLYRCNTCTDLFDDLPQLKFHVKHHPDSPSSKRFSCHQCEMTFSHKQNLVRHLSVHSGAKPFVCKYCDKGFPTATNQRRHERIHEGLKPYPCQHCGAAFSQSGDLKKHIRKLHRDFFFPCAFCLKYYAEEAQLCDHVLSHGKTLELNRKALKKKTSGVKQPQQPNTMTVVAIIEPPPPPPPTTAAPRLLPQLASAQHSVSKEYFVRCHSCNKRFATRINLRRHQRLAHPVPQRPRRNGEGASVRRPPPDADQYRGPSTKTRGQQQPLMPSKFFASVSQNIAHNLQHYIDGKPTPPSRHSVSPSKPAPTGSSGTTTTDLRHHALDLTWSYYNFPAGYDGNVEDPAVTGALSPPPRRDSAVYDVVAEDEPSATCSSTWPLRSRSGTGMVTRAGEEEEGSEYGDEDFTDDDEDRYYESGALDLSPVRDPAHAEAHCSTDKANAITLYLCYACGEKFFSVAEIEEHKVNNHPNVYCTHLEIEGSTKNIPLELLRSATLHQCSPVGLLHRCPVPPLAVATPSAQLRCTKCQHSFQKTAELHEHILVCGVQTTDAVSATDKDKAVPGTVRSASQFLSLPRSGSSGKKTVSRGMKRSLQDNEAPAVTTVRRATPTSLGRKQKKSRKDGQSPTPPHSSSERSSADTKPSRTPSPADVATMIEQQQQVLDEIALTCDGCNRKFKYASALERHQRYCQEEAGIVPSTVPIQLLHDGPKKGHTCQHCSRSFAYLATLKRHVTEFCGTARSASEALISVDSVASNAAPSPPKKGKVAIKPILTKKMARRKLRRRKKGVPKTAIANMTGAVGKAKAESDTAVEQEAVEPRPSSKNESLESNDCQVEVDEGEIDSEELSVVIETIRHEELNPVVVLCDVVAANRRECTRQSTPISAVILSPGVKPKKAITPLKEPVAAADNIIPVKVLPPPVVAEPVKSTSLPGIKPLKSVGAIPPTRRIKTETIDTAPFNMSPVSSPVPSTPASPNPKGAAQSTSKKTDTVATSKSPLPVLSPKSPVVPLSLTTNKQVPDAQITKLPVAKKQRVTKTQSPALANLPSAPLKPALPASSLQPLLMSTPPPAPPPPASATILPPSISFLPASASIPTPMPSLPPSISLIPIAEDGRPWMDKQATTTAFAGITISSLPAQSVMPVLLDLPALVPPSSSLASPTRLLNLSSVSTAQADDDTSLPNEECMMDPDGVMIKVENIDDALRRDQQHTCPNCKRTFTYLANFKKHLTDLCPLRMIRRDESSDHALTLVATDATTTAASSVTTITTATEELADDEMPSPDVPSSGVPAESETPLKPAVFPCTICHKEFGAFVTMLKHRLSHKLRPSADGSATSPGIQAGSSPTKPGAHLDWKRPYSWFNNKLQQSLNRGGPQGSPQPILQPMPQLRPGRPIGSTVAGYIHQSVAPKLPRVPDQHPQHPQQQHHTSESGHVNQSQGDAGSKAALPQTEWLDINAVLNMQDCYYDDEEYAEPALSTSSQSTSLSETSSTITRALSSVYRSALIHKVDEPNTSDHHPHIHHDPDADERHLLAGGDELANLDS